MGKNRYNLTFPQENILLMERYNKDSSVNVITGLINIDRDFDEKSCNRALNELIKANDALRTKVFEESGEFFQEFFEYKYEEFEVIDMSSNSKDEILEYIDDLASQSLFAYNKKLYDFKILKYSSDTGSIFMRSHHIISDAWSCSKIGNQLINYLENKAESLEENNIPSYIEFITAENEYKISEKFAKDSEFWKEYLNGVTETVSLKDKKSNISSKANRYSVKLEEKINDNILKYCKENRVSPYALFLAAFSTYIYRIKDKNDFVLGTPVLNRANFKEKQMLGMFVSTLPLRIKINEGENFLELVKNIGKDTLSVFRHQKYPYMKTLEYVRKNTNITSNLYSMVLSYQNARVDMVDETKYSTSWAFAKELEDDLQIHIMDMDDSGILNINYDYRTELFENIEIEYLHTRIMAIIENAIADLEVNVEDIRIMSKEEENKILYEFNDTKKDYPKDKTVIDLFEEQVEKNPNNIALISGDKKITYKEFFEKASSVALQLRSVVNENIIIMLDDYIEVVTAIYGVLMSGNCYVPLNVSTPVERLKNIVNDCNCKYAIMKNKILDELTYIDFKKVDKLKMINRSRPNKLAYMIYTSGSTGVPKGVKISNKSLMNYIWWARRSYVSSDKPIMPLYSSIAFDLTVTTIFLPIICGGTIIIYNNISDEIIKVFREDKVNIVKLTPAHLTLINELDVKLSNIKTLILGGESLKISDVRKIYNHNNKLSIFNEYGPTEATVGCMIYKYSNEDDNNAILSIGKPSDNNQIFVMDKKRRIYPLGIEGELYIQGDSVSLGYNNLPDKNLESFLKHPFSNEIMYKTGDIGILDFNLNIKYIGRKDKQIKINGNRIELEEIEHIANKSLKFKNTVADVKYISNNPNICLYYISDIEYEPNYIASKLRENLPYYMVPSKYIKIDKIPINKNGKVVKNELPIPQINKTERKKDIEYRNNIERLVCEVWKEILDKTVTPEDNIFDFGVDSLSMIRCQVKLSQYTNVIDIQKFYQYPIIREFCNNFYEKKSDKVDSKELLEFKDIKFSKELKNYTNTGNVILVGATGYLGIHLLKELIENSNIKQIFCIVRGIGYEERLKAKYNFFFSNKNELEYNEKVRVINGVIEEENFGLKTEQLEKITLNCSRIINAAAIVKHHGEYSEFERINVKSVKNIINICEKYNIVLDHISTISISGDGSSEKFDENKFYIGQNFQINPYIKSKFLAEKFILKNIKLGSLQANIYRVGNLTWRYIDGMYQENILDNGFFMRIKNMVSLCAYPESIKEMDIEMTPVDIAAEFIISIIMNCKEINKIYHIYNPNIVKFIEIIRMFNRAYIKLTELPDEKFMELLKSYDSKENILLNDIINSMDTLKVKIDNKATINELIKYNKCWPKLDYDYISKLCDYLDISEEC